MQNQSFVTEFILLGLSQNPKVEKILFIVFLFVYIATLGGNMIIVVTIIFSPALLGSPMYFFLAFPSLLDACTSTTVTPKMIVDLFYKRKTISFECCMTQLFTSHFFAGVEVIVLTAMAYDRYVAICKPLHYSSIMTRRLCGTLIGVAWTGGFIHSITQVIFTLQLPFCGPNFIDHFICDLFPLLQLACTDTHIFVILVFANSGSFCIIIFSLLIVSYGVILFSLRGHSSEGRIYFATIGGNMITAAAIIYSPELMGAPMYFFLVFLSLLDACTSTDVTPMMIVGFFYERKTISFEGCMAQLFAIHFFTAVEVIILSVMAYDRYVAICKPLH
ncbi:Olfactory receptor 4C15 [Microtus ochrogaster]|uniref:Olfactory receptor n=1 Tax=Microtus ochrogaster TaxID=79684 RepID=A0A8J6G4Q3_MICOH|nr:Olfactory receptor 4C15 [Microtus ochrogaster]